MFNCIYNSQGMSRLMEWLDVPWRNRGLLQLYRWTRGRDKGTKLRKQVLLATIASSNCIYLIWKNRNSAYWDNIVTMNEKTIQKVKYIVKHRSLQVLSAKINDRDKRWIENLSKTWVCPVRCGVVAVATLWCFLGGF